MDFEGLTIGFISFFFILILSFYLYQKYDLNRVSILRLTALSALGHFAGGVIFYWFALHNGGDSRFYFYYATTKFEGLGYHFVLFLFGHLRALFMGDSLLGAFLFSAALGFLGSVFYLLTFKMLLDKISLQQKYFLYDKKILFFPAFILLCWPSYFFWSAGLGKDSLSFLAIGMFLFALANQRINLQNVFIFFSAVLIGLLVRPYLFFIVGSAVLFYILFMSKIKPAAKIALLVVLALLASKLFFIVMKATNLTGQSVHQISQLAINNQMMTNNIGSTNIPLPTRNVYLIYLFLPYLMAGNLLLPLFMGAKNLMTMVSSVENLYFIYILSIFIKNMNIWRRIRVMLPITNFFIIYFLTGIGFLGLINTNLGLAMREKMMYVPAFLIIILLVYAYKRILFIQYHFSQQEEVVPLNSPAHLEVVKG